MATIESFSLHHIGVAVTAFEDVLPFYCRTGYVPGPSLLDPEQDVMVCVLRREGMPLVELLAPFDQNSPINNILAKAGAGPYHMCYSVSNLEEAIRSLKADRFLLVSRPKVSNVFDNRHVCFLFRKDVGLIELIEEIAS